MICHSEQSNSHLVPVYQRESLTMNYRHQSVAVPACSWVEVGAANNRCGEVRRRRSETEELVRKQDHFGQTLDTKCVFALQTKDAAEATGSSCCLKAQLAEKFKRNSRFQPVEGSLYRYLSPNMQNLKSWHRNGADSMETLLNTQTCCFSTPPQKVVTYMFN